MAEKKRGLFNTVRARAMAHWGTLKTSASAFYKQKVTELRESVQPEKTKADLAPERFFDRTEHGADVKRIVWTGHTVETGQAQRFFGAVGLTKEGYYRAAEVQAYGGHEEWRWQSARYADKNEAVERASGLSMSKLHPETDKVTSPQINTGGEERSIREVWRSSDVEQRFGGGQSAPRVRGNAVIGQSAEGFHARIDATHESHTPGVGWQSVPIQERWSAAMPTKQAALQGAKRDLRDFNRFWAERVGKEPSANSPALSKAISSGRAFQQDQAKPAKQIGQQQVPEDRFSSVFDRIGKSKERSPGHTPIKERSKDTLRFER